MAPETAVADAEVISLGTRGRPGRGSGTERPSAAARDLAPGYVAGKRPDRGGRDPGKGKQEPPPEPAASRSPVPGQPPRTESIPVGELLAALATGAREVFGADWEPRLAEFLAFLRRRVSGQYEVDEFGFDREVTERFLLAAVRPLAQKWFRVEVRGVRTSRSKAAPSSCPTIPAPSPSTGW